MEKGAGFLDPREGAASLTDTLVGNIGGGGWVRKPCHKLLAVFPQGVGHGLPNQAPSFA